MSFDKEIKKIFEKEGDELIRSKKEKILSDDFFDSVRSLPQQNNKRPSILKPALALAMMLLVVCGSVAAIPFFTREQIPPINTTSDTSINSTDRSDNINSPSNVRPPVPPLQMESIDEVVSVLASYDIQSYREEFQAKYNELFSVLKSSDFIYNVVASDDMDIEDAITFMVINEKNIFYLMPYAKYEDIGIISYVTFRGAVYQVCIYNVDAEVLSKAETISEYVEARLCLNVLNEMIVEENTVCFMRDGNTVVHQKNYAASFIDGDHYYVVSAEVTQDDLKTFLDFLNFEKIFIE